MNRITQGMRAGKVRFWPVVLIIVLLSTPLVLPHSAHAATIVWNGAGTTGTCGTGNDNNWSCASNWVGGVVPTAADTVTFNATSAKASIVDAGFAGQITTLNFSAGYTGTTTLARQLITTTLTKSTGTLDLNGQTLEVDGALTISGGTFLANGGTLAIGGTANAVLSCNNTVFNLVTFINTAGTKTVNANCTLPLGANPVLPGTGTLAIAGTISGSGTLTKTAGAVSFTSASSTLTNFTGLNVLNLTVSGGSFNSNASSTLTSAVVNGAFSMTSGTTTAPSGTFTFNAGFSITGGNFAANNGTVAIASSTNATIACNGAAFNLVTFSGISTNATKTISSNCTIPLGSNATTSGTISNNGTITASSTWTVAGNLTNNSGGTVNYSGTTLTVKGNLTQLGTFNLSGKTVLFNGSDSTLSCSGALGGTVQVSLIAGSFINTAGCSISLGANPTTVVGDHFTNNGSITVDSGTWTMSSLAGAGAAYASLTNFGLDLSGTQKWRGGAVGLDGSIYTFPQDTATILKINPSSNTASLSTMGADLSGTQKWYGGARAANGKIYGIPMDVPGILIIDPSTGTATTSTMGLNLSDGLKWVHGVLGNDGKIYGMPNNSTDILIIDPATDTATRSAMGIPDLSDQQKWRDGALGSDGKIYGVPYYSPDILIIDPSSGTATRSKLGATGLTTAITKYVSAVRAPNGKIYAIPQQAQQILIIDPSTGTATTSTMGADFSGPLVNNWAGGAVGLDGKIYSIPFDSADSLVIDPVAGTATRSKLGAELKSRRIGAVVAPDGRIYGIPSDATTTLVIDFSGPTFTNSGLITHNGTNWDLSNLRMMNNASGTIIAPNGTTTTQGNWVNNGTFTAGTGTVSLTGTNQTISGTTTFNNLSKTVTSSDTLTFDSGNTQTVSGMLTLTGASTGGLSLRSSTPGTQWNINPQGGYSLSYLNVQDSNNTSSTSIATTGLHISDSGNNTGWTFAGNSSPTSAVTPFVSSRSISGSSVPISTSTSATGSSTTTTTTVTTSTTLLSIVRDLSLGSVGLDVQALQVFLNTHGHLLAQMSYGSPGNETTYFGTLTRAALAGYQSEHNISPPAGYFGPITRAFIRSIGQ